MERVFEINEDEIELPRFAIDGEINRVQTFQCRGYPVYCASFTAT